MSGSSEISGAVTGASAYTTDPLSDAEKTDLRRFMGYPALGAAAAGQSSWRFFAEYGQNEWRMSTLAPAELQQARLYLAQLYPLETAILGASDTLDTERAAIWVRNRYEIGERIRLFNAWRRRLCGFLGTPPGPDLCVDGWAVVI